MVDVKTPYFLCPLFAYHPLLLHLFPTGLSLEQLLASARHGEPTVPWLRPKPPPQPTTIYCLYFYLVSLFIHIQCIVFKLNLFSLLNTVLSKSSVIKLLLCKIIFMYVQLINVT